jgi:hypothetical protein
LPPLTVADQTSLLNQRLRLTTFDGKTIPVLGPDKP